MTVNETLKAATSTSNAEQLPAPKGIGMAVAFDWGLTVELFLIPDHGLAVKQTSNCHLV